MPINKSAYKRYLILDECFKNPEEMYFISDLLEECIKKTGHKISKSTIDKDIRNMRKDLNAPIEVIKNGKSGYYRYSDLTFSMNKEELNPEEKQQLKSAIAALKRFRGLPQFEWIEDISEKLETSLKLKFSEKQIVFFESNPDLKGKDFFKNLFDAIIAKQVLKIEYKNFSAIHPEILTIHPYILKEYNNRWYILGYCDEGNKIYNLALDRINKIEKRNVEYIESSKNFEEFFDDIIGVTFLDEEKIEEVELKFSEKTINYIKTKPIHLSQTNIKGKSNTIRLKIKTNYEFESLLLSYGSNVEVIAPKSLRNKIKEETKRMFFNYNSNDCK